MGCLREKLRKETQRNDFWNNYMTLGTEGTFGAKLDPSKGGAKWGWIRMSDEKDLPRVFEAVKQSYQLIKRAIKNNEPTGWYAKVEQAEGEGT